MTLQPFKPNDLLEPRVASCFVPVVEELNEERDTFYAGAYQAAPLGDVLYELGRDPLVGVIDLEIYRESFPAIHELFTRPATFEYYLTVFRAIFGDNVNVVFTVPGPGKLLINADALDPETFRLLARKIQDDSYLYNLIVTSDLGDNIVAQGTQGIKTQNEMNSLIFELSVAGIWTVCTLTL